MWTFETIQTWATESFTRLGVEWRRFKSPQGESVEVAATARVSIRASIGCGAIIGYRASIGRGAIIGDRASIGYRAIIGCGASIGDGVSIGCGDQWVTVGPLGRDGRMLTIVCRDGATHFYTGCFGGDRAEFEAAIEATHGDNDHGVAYRRAVAYADAVFGIEPKSGRERFRDSHHHERAHAMNQ